MKTVAVVTTSRADYGIYRSLLKRLSATSDLRLRLMVSGSHLSDRHGRSVRVIEADGFAVDDRVEVLLASDSAGAIASAMGLAVLGFGQCFARRRPDWLIVLGDRFEMHAAAVAAVPFQIPVVHLHGGEITQGAFDDALRHSMTKLSALHMVATENAARRLRQMGEEPWRITVSGAPGLDGIEEQMAPSRRSVEEQFGVKLDGDFLLVTIHSETLGDAQPSALARSVLAAVESTDLPAVVTMPNADPGGIAIREVVLGAASRVPRIQPVENLGSAAYFRLMCEASAMVGNSSSGLIEAPSFGLPVVNVGARQAGRLRGANVIDTGTTEQDIRDGLNRALEPSFRASLKGMTNPYGDGHAAERIVERLQAIEPSPAIVRKLFQDHESVP